MNIRRSIEEIVSIYELEPSIRDIYVEGSRDRSFFSWLIESGAKSRSEVYAINDIEVSEEILNRYDLPLGSNRYRVIAASMAVSEALPDNLNALFLVDRDFSEYINENILSESLRLTDYNSLELYALNEMTIGKIMALLYGNYATSPPIFYIDMKEVLKKLYAIRLSNIKLGWKMEWLNPTKYVKVGQAIAFEKEKYIEAYLKKNSKWNKKSIFLEMLDSVIGSLKSDCRLSVRGHDFAQILLHILNKKSKGTSKISNVSIFEGVLLASLEKNELIKESMINEVVGFSKSP